MESLDVNGFVGSLKKSKTQPKRIAEINEIANRAWADVGLKLIQTCQYQPVVLILEQNEDKTLQGERI